MPINPQEYERLGVFYLGREYDLDQRAPNDQLLLYDSKDLVTHAVIVGMTGSGKTGLGITLLEEAAIDGIPALIIDPKGDLANLLLTFPRLQAADFAPWINPEDARRQGKTNDEFAAEQAQRWHKGLAEWGQDGERIQRLRAAAEVALYTPGSTAATPLSIVQSFAAPPEALRDDAEALRERVGNAATSLLGLMGVTGDPLQSPEHILLASILAHAWKQGNDVDLAQLIHLIQTPPFTRVGVMDLESFLPAKERFALALRLNNLLASPGFETWLQGPPLDIGSLLFTPEGKPRLAILSIAHLGDQERMFFVTLVLNQVLSWMRAQPGTTSLRALLYMDEIFGYFPPVANPPSKLPLLTLLKQARAFGLGVVLATQNPVDLDYKGLSNAGTWCIGRLQTERDKARVLDGLEGAASSAGGAFERGSMDRLLSGLGNRVFLLNNVHDQGPCVFQVRWTMSYLRGPLTRSQLKQLSGSTASAQAATTTASSEVPGAAGHEPAPPKKPLLDAEARPVLPAAVPQVFLPPATPQPVGSCLVYSPYVLGQAQVYYQDAKKSIDHQVEVALLAEFPESPAGLSWADAATLDMAEDELESEPQDQARFGELPADAGKAKSYDGWKKGLVDYLFRDFPLELWESAALGITSAPGESERDFRVRLTQQGREERDLQAEKLRQKFAPKLNALQERLRKAQVTVEKEKSQASQSKLQTVLNFGASILGAFLGRKAISVANVTKATTVVRSAGKTMKESQDVQYAEQNTGAIQAQIAELERQFEADVQNLHERLDADAAELMRSAIKPKKTNIQVRNIALAWAPCWRGHDGTITSAWRK